MKPESLQRRARVLTVGHCGFDHPQLQRLIERYFNADVEQAATAAEAERLLDQQGYDLLLVNRLFDADGDSGIDWIRRMKAKAQGQAVKFMLVSNYPEAQAAAQQAGALAGFGKNALGQPGMLHTLSQHLPKLERQVD